MSYKNVKSEIEALDGEIMPASNSDQSKIRPKKFQEKYVVPHLEGCLWDQSLKEIITKDQKACIKFIKDNHAKLYLTDYKIYMLINAMASDDSKDAMMKLYRELYRSDEINMVKVKNGEMNLEKVSGEQINAKVLSNILSHLFADDKRIKTPARKGHSHFDAINLATNLGLSCSVVTGYVYGISNRSKHLHSWVETVLDGESVVLDYTMNAIINREAYYSLRKVQPLSRVRDFELEADGKVVFPYIEQKQLSYSEYLICRDEVLNNIAQNEKEEN